MLSHPLPLLPFDHAGAEQLEWDGATDEITFAAPVGQTFRCAHDALHRIEIFIEPTFHFKRSHLWLIVFEGEASRASTTGAPRPVRVAGPLAAEALVAHGWFAFEFEPIATSAGRDFTFLLQSPDATPGDALSVRALTRDRRGRPGLSVGGRPRAGTLAFRASCVRAPALLANFQRFRRQAVTRAEAIDYQPLLARLEISRPCNLHCIMCQRGLHPFDAKREAPGFMSLPTFRALDPILPTLLRVVAFGLGEPFLNPHYLEILRHARTRNPFAHVFTSTNGTCLADEAIAALLDEGLLSELQISLDGAERETFERIRRQASFDTVIGAFERVTAARARRASPALSITGAMLVMKPNFTQILAFARRMADLGVDRVSFDSPKDAAFKPLRADSNDEMARVMEQVAQAGEFLARTGIELSGPLLSELLVWHRTTGQPGTPPRWGVDECAQLAGPPGARETACGVPWESFVLSADGTVNVCCNSLRRLGHVREAAFGAAWETGSPYGALRRELVARALHADCHTCLGENFVVPGEATPAIYLRGCLPDTGHSALLARRLGARIVIEDTPDRATPAVRATLDPIESRTAATRPGAPWRVSGWVEGNRAGGLAASLTLAIAVDGIGRGFTSVAPVSARRGQWSAVIAGVPPPADARTITVFEVVGGGMRPIPLVASGGIPPLRIADGPRLHGYVDEVRATDGTLHLIGWARDASARAPAASVVALARDRALRALVPWLPRPDVGRAFGDPAGNFGFSIEVPLAGLAGIRPRSVKVFAVAPDGLASPLEWSELAVNCLEALLERSHGINPGPDRPAARPRCRPLIPLPLEYVGAEAGP